MSRICSDFAYGDGPIENSFWTETVTPAARASLAQEITTEVAIIGAGFTGLNAALRLAEAGVDVTVLDAKQVGWGASGRNGGFCCLGGAKASFATIASRIGETDARDYAFAERDAVDHVSDLIDRFGLEVDKHSDGETGLAHRARDFAGFSQEADRLKALYGVTAQIIPKQELREHGFGGDFYGAMTTPIGFALNPLKYVTGLAAQAEAAGAVIHGDTMVRQTLRDGAGWRLVTDRGVLRAKKLVIATNGYSSESVPDWMAGRYLPTQSSILVTRKLTADERKAQGWTSSQMSYDTRNLLHYIRLMPDGRFLFGTRGGISTSERVHHAMRRKTRQHFERMFPAWAQVETPWYWSGFVCISRDFTPFAGAVPGEDGLYAAFGYHGNGVAMGSYAGALVAQSILGEAKLRSPLLMQKPPPRFPGGRLRRLGMYPAYLSYGLADL